MVFGDVFAAMLLLVMGLFLLILGIFASYFGFGKVRISGVGLGAGGGIIWLIIYLVQGTLNINLILVIYNGILYLVSAVVGAIIALLIFLAVLLKT